MNQRQTRVMHAGFVLVALLAGCGDQPTGTDPGRPVVRRLNRTEYNNTVRDLFGTAQRPADAFPADDFGLGFDNIGEVLSLSALHIEGYDAAADALVDELFAFGNLPTTTTTFEAEGPGLVADNGGVWDVTHWVLWTEGQLAGTVWIETAGDYTVHIDAAGQQAGDEPVKMAVRVNGVEAATFDVVNESTAGFDATVYLEPGRQAVSVAYLNEYKAPPEEDRNLLIDRFAVTGPLNAALPPHPSPTQVIDCDPVTLGEAACAEHVARTFGRKAFRRPLTEEELAERMAAYAEVVALGGSWEEAMRGLLRSLLLAPQFIYRAEADAASGVRPLNSFELASRLSYFLWSSTPDDRLLDLAQTGQLTDPEILASETKRMVADWRAEALVLNLAGQWLGIRKVEEAQPNADLFPEWDEELQAAMESEVELFIGNVIRSDRPVTDLLTTDETFVNARLAEFYGLPAPSSDAIAPVSMPERRGLLGRAGLLAALSYPTRTSPVVRGNWVLSNLLCAPPPPPPAVAIPPFPEEPAEAMSLRETLEQHREDPVCAQCHLEMDAIGLALEAYDPTGQLRTIDDFGQPVDTTGTLDGLGSFADANELQALLATDVDFAQCFVQKTFIYAVGRDVTPDDLPVLDAIAVEFAGGGYRFDDLLQTLVQTRAFRWRNGVAP